MTTMQRFADAVFGPPLERKPPERVLRAIRRQEDESEILVGWLQIAAIGFFAVLYAISPKAFTMDVRFAPVPITLAVYAVFTTLRLVLAYRGRLTAFWLTLSVIVDIAVLMITIWSFHLQYGQPPALYLKAPTLLYVFIIIALRALRFDARWVVLAGATAAAGWLVLLLYALNEGGMGAMVTRSFVEYATSLKLLVGAEVDKIVSILVVTAVLAVVLVRARRLLVRSVADATASAELSRFFAPDIAETIVTAEEAIKPGTGVPRQAAVLFIDLRGFTTLSSTMEPSDLVALLGEYQGIVVPIIRRHHGSIITYLGDGIMVTFGATRPTTSYAADAVAATEELTGALSEWTAKREAAGLLAPAAGIGVAGGRVIYGAIGTEGRLEYAVIGDPVSRSAKLQALTKTEGARAIIAENIYRLAAEQGYRGRHQPAVSISTVLPGIAEPMAALALQ